MCNHFWFYMRWHISTGVIVFLQWLCFVTIELLLDFKIYGHLLSPDVRQALMLNKANVGESFVSTICSKIYQVFPRSKLHHATKMEIRQQNNSTTCLVVNIRIYRINMDLFKLPWRQFSTPSDTIRVSQTNKSVTEFWTLLQQRPASPSAAAVTGLTWSFSLLCACSFDGLCNSNAGLYTTGSFPEKAAGGLACPQPR